jgi:hypothetical protein
MKAGSMISRLGCCCALSLALLAAPAAAQDRCLLDCDEHLFGADAVLRAEELLDMPLPEGVEVTVVHEGGFQDPFLQLRLEVPKAETERVVALLGGTLAEFAPLSTETFGPGGSAWWDVETRGGVRAGRGDLNTYDWTMIGVSEPRHGRRSIYVWAFQT